MRFDFDPAKAHAGFGIDHHAVAALHLGAAGQIVVEMPRGLQTDRDDLRLQDQGELHRREREADFYRADGRFQQARTGAAAARATNSNTRYRRRSLADSCTSEVKCLAPNADTAKGSLASGTLTTTELLREWVLVRSRARLIARFRALSAHNRRKSSSSALTWSSASSYIQ